MPREGDTVTIPAGKTVVLDTSPSRLAGLQVDGMLRFKDKKLNLYSDWIVVHGKLEVGTERTPFRSKVRIVLTGDDETQNIMNMGPRCWA